MEQTNTIEQLRDSEHLRKYDDITTWSAEMLEGSMRTPFEFTFDGHDIYGHDGLPLTPVFDNAITDAKRTANQNESLEFEVRRRTIEREELEDMFSMVRGEAPNTMVVVSDFVGELMEATEDVGGYNVKRKQTMLRVISRRPDGTISMVSQSLEGSDRSALEAIYASLGIEAQPGELLGQRIKLDTGTEEQEFMVDQLMGVYDRKLEENYGGIWRAGWRLPTERANTNTYDFVLQQKDLLETLLARDDALNGDHLYGFAAALRHRFESTIHQVSEQFTVEPQSVFIGGNPAMEMYQAAISARAEGRVFSGCGISVRPEGDESSTLNELSELGYGNKAEEDKYGSLIFDCPNGHKNKRRRNKLIDECKTCGTSVKC